MFAVYIRLLAGDVADTPAVSFDDDDEPTEPLLLLDTVDVAVGRIVILEENTLSCAGCNGVGGTNTWTVEPDASPLEKSTCRPMMARVARPSASLGRTEMK